MTNEIFEQMNAQAQKAPALGATIKFVLDGKTIFVDGTGDKNVVSGDDKDADCTITTTAETLMKVKSGDLNPMMAAMTGKIKISGDMSLALKLQSLIS